MQWSSGSQIVLLAIVLTKCIGSLFCPVLIYQIRQRFNDAGRRSVVLLRCVIKVYSSCKVASVNCIYTRDWLRLCMSLVLTQIILHHRAAVSVIPVCWNTSAMWTRLRGPERCFRLCHNRLFIRQLEPVMPVSRESKSGVGVLKAIPNCRQDKAGSQSQTNILRTYVLVVIWKMVSSLCISEFSFAAVETVHCAGQNLQVGCWTWQSTVISKSFNNAAGCPQSCFQCRRALLWTASRGTD